MSPVFSRFICTALVVSPLLFPSSAAGGAVQEDWSEDSVTPKPRRGNLRSTQGHGEENTLDEPNPRPSAVNATALPWLAGGPDNEGAFRGLKGSGPNEERDLTIYGGLYGGWGGWVEAQEPGFYACGARIRYEDPQGDGDDTAANGLKLRFCSLSDWHNQKDYEIHPGYWGGWKNWVMCPYGKYITSAEVRFEDNQGGGDDTALNGLKIGCIQPDGSGVEGKTVYGGHWGSWKGWRYDKGSQSGEPKLVKGARMRIEGKQGSGDDTAWNGLMFRVELANYGVSTSVISGSWVLETSGHQGQITFKITESTETTNGKELTTEQAYGVEATISAGFSLKGVDVGMEVSGSYSRTTAEMVSSSLTVSHEKEWELNCPESGSPTGRFYLWQFHMNQESDAAGPGFDLSSKHVRCTPYANMRPLCALGNCRDEFCQVCDNNLALHKPATQSSTGWGGDASRAVDGNKDPYWSGRSITNTRLDNNPYWEVDLESFALVQEVVLFNRVDCCSDLLADAHAQVMLLDASNTVVYTSAEIGSTKAEISVSIPAGTAARKVRVQLTGSTYLSLREVEVYGIPL